MKTLAESYRGLISEEIKQFGVEELEALGAYDVRCGYSCVYFDADEETLMKIVYSARLFSRFVAPLFHFKGLHADHLYKKSRAYEWENIFREHETFAIYANTSGQIFNHSQFATQKLKDGIVDRFTRDFGSRPSVDRDSPDVMINLFAEDDWITVSLDLSGRACHHRGYRSLQGEAPIRENVAAAMVHLARWNGEVPLVDPFCGSGTVAIEAYMRAAKVPTLYLRGDNEFGFLRLPDFDASQWVELREKIDAEIITLPAGFITASDIDPQMIDYCRANAKYIPGANECINFKVSDYKKTELTPETVLITNPPFGVRLERGGADQLLQGFIAWLKETHPGGSAFVYLGEPELIKKAGLPPARKTPLNSGGLQGRLVKYEVYRRRES